MTCIVGYTENGVTWMGADSLGVNGDMVTKRKDRKIFKKNLGVSESAIMSFTTSFRMGQILMYGEDFLNIEIPKDGTLSHKDIVTNTIPKIISLFEDSGYLQKDSYGQLLGGEFLLASKGSLFKIYGDFQVVESIDNMFSSGCGEQFAIGALYTLKDDDMPASNKVLAALEAAEKFSSGVGRPFYIMNTENDEVIEIR